MMAAAGLWLWGKVQPFLVYILLGLAAVGTVLAVLARVKRAGVLQERVETMQRTIDQVKVKQDVKREVRDDLRKSGKSAADRLRDEWQRD